MKDLLLVAEIGLNHDGNFDLAYELIRQAKWAGADVVKFQFGWRSQPGEINAIDDERAFRLKGWCEGIGIQMGASLITEEGLRLAKAIGLPFYKIASRTVTENPDLCRRILSEGRPTYVSLGLWEGPGFPFGPPDEGRLHYLYCRSFYPTYPEELAGFPERFSPEGYFGYSDHCHGIAACLLAIARGAGYLEKHFTLNKASAAVRDHVLSATPEEFRVLAMWGRELHRLQGVGRLTETTDRGMVEARRRA